MTRLSFRLKKLLAAIVLLWLLGISASSLAETVAWSRIYPSGSFSLGSDIAVDRDGNAYATGLRSDGVTYAGTDTDDVLLVNLDTNGNKVWSHDSTGHSIALDKDGGVSSREPLLKRRTRSGTT